MESSTTLTLFRVNEGHSTCAADVAAALAGQTSSDWSAIYAQYTMEHAERYLANRWGQPSCTTAELIQRKTVPPVPKELTGVTTVLEQQQQQQLLCVLPLLDDWMRDAAKPSLEKATWPAMQSRSDLALIWHSPDRRTMRSRL